MIQLSIEVSTADGTTGSYRVTPRVQIDFERHFKMSIIAAFADAPAMEHLYWLGWRAMSVAGQTSDDFEAWLDAVRTVTPSGVESSPLTEG